MAFPKFLSHELDDPAGGIAHVRHDPVNTDNGENCAKNGQIRKTVIMFSPKEQVAGHYSNQEQDDRGRSGRADQDVEQDAAPLPPKDGL